MGKTKTYEHFCAMARTLEVVGEKWTLLVVRDLMRGPQRFSDLLHYIAGITPKWLTARLRDLEAEGVIERDSEPGRREVWYRLTPKGRDLRPVLESLLVWGVEHAMKPPAPGEAVYPEVVLQGTSIYMNHRDFRLPRAATWEFQTEGNPPVQLHFDGERWSSRNADTSATKADVTIATTPVDLVTFLNARRRERLALLESLSIEGSPKARDLFLTSMVANAAEMT